MTFAAVCTLRVGGGREATSKHPLHSLGELSRMTVGG